MVFNQLVFFYFLFAFFFVDFLIKKGFKENSIGSIKPNKVLLLVASYFFYCFWDWRFGFLLLWSTIIDFYVGKYIQGSGNSKNRKVALWFSLINNLGLLAIFKYFNFFLDNFYSVLDLLNFSYSPFTLSIILPVGISFYTFQTMSYTIDVYRKEMIATDSFLDFSIFVSFFPQLVAGPIERAKNLLPRVKNYHGIIWSNFPKGFNLIFMGLVKKVLIADNIAPYVDSAFSNIGELATYDAWSTIILFSFQILFDFAGYSDIARGLGKILGLDLMKNFNQPYFSFNFSEFWSRWHISLSTWLRDYLYIPLGGNRIGKLNTYRNLFLTMLIGGLWHGASWNFILWGGLHGIYLMIFKLLKIGDKIKLSGDFNSKYFWMPVVYFLVLITWVPFRAANFEESIMFFEKMFFISNGINFKLFFVMIVAVFGFFLVELPAFITRRHNYLLSFPKGIKWGVYLVGSIFIVTQIILNKDIEKPFIYFQF